MLSIGYGTWNLFWNIHYGCRFNKEEMRFVVVLVNSNLHYGDRRQVLPWYKNLNYCSVTFLFPLPFQRLYLYEATRRDGFIWPGNWAYEGDGRWYARVRYSLGWKLGIKRRVRWPGNLEREKTAQPVAARWSKIERKGQFRHTKGKLLVMSNEYHSTHKWIFIHYHCNS